METTNPDVEVETQAPPTGDLSPEDRLEALFKGGEKPAQEAKEDPPDEEGATVEEDAEETKAEEAPEGQPEAEEEAAELEIDGETYSVPKKLEAAFLRQKDYTQKTQELAAQRKQVEERQAFLQSVEEVRGAVFEKAVEIAAVEKQLARFDQLDWNALANEGGPEYLRLDRAYRELKDQQSRLNGEVQGLVSKQQEVTAQQRQALLEKGNKELSEAIKGWNPEVGRKILQSSTHYGFSEAELAEVVDPRYVRVLHDAHQWRELQKSKTTIVKKKVDQAKPITVKAARSSQNNQVASQLEAAKAKVRKSGNARDAEDYLARLFERKKRY
jgi:hypothetical protein